MSKLDELLKVTPGYSKRTLLELAFKVIAENRVTFDGIAEILVDDASDDAVEVYRRLVKEIFADSHPLGQSNRFLRTNNFL